MKSGGWYIQPKDEQLEQNQYASFPSSSPFRVGVGERGKVGKKQKRWCGEEEEVVTGEEVELRG